MTPHLGRWLIPLLAGLGVLGLFWYLLVRQSTRRRSWPPPRRRPCRCLPPAPVPSLPAHLALTNDDGVITYSGVVHDESTRTLDHGRAEGRVRRRQGQGRHHDQRQCRAGPWLVNLRTALESSARLSGVQAVFDGNSLKVGGLIGDSDRDGIISSLRAAPPHRSGVWRAHRQGGQSGLRHHKNRDGAVFVAFGVHHQRPA